MEKTLEHHEANGDAVMVVIRCKVGAGAGGGAGAGAGAQALGTGCIHASATSAGTDG